MWFALTAQIRLVYLLSSFCCKCLPVRNHRGGTYPKDVTTKPSSRWCGYASTPFKPRAIFIVCAATDVIRCQAYRYADIHVLLETEKSIQRDRKPFFELFTVPRNRRATLASFIVMFMCVVTTFHVFSI